MKKLLGIVVTLVLSSVALVSFAQSTTAPAVTAPAAVDVNTPAPVLDANGNPIPAATTGAVGDAATNAANTVDQAANNAMNGSVVPGANPTTTKPAGQ